ncbi:CotH kinase family protein [Fibrobacterota bacterium]
MTVWNKSSPLLFCACFWCLWGCLFLNYDREKTTENTDSLFVNEVVSRPWGGGTDWIELYAAGSKSVNLASYSLRDDNSDHQRAGLPDRELKPGEFLVIIANDSGSGGGGYSVPFKLGSADAVTLFKNDAIVDELDWVDGDAPQGGSFGRYPDGTGNPATLIPTPGRPNILYDSSGPPLDTLYEYGGTSGQLFEDTSIYAYELEFYTPDWQTQLELNYLNGELYLPARLTFGNLVIDSIGVRYKGNSSFMRSRNTPKKPLKFRFDSFKNISFYGLRYLNFSNCVSDPTFMREKIAYDIVRQYLPAPRTAYANIYIEGKLLGLYMQIEQVDEIFIGKHFSDNQGDLFKAGDNGAPMEYLGADPAGYVEHFELKTNAAIDDWSGFITFLDKLNNAPAEAFIDSLGGCLNLDYAIRHIAFNMAVSHFDSYTGSGRNYYLYDDPPSGRFHMLHWDLNEAFGAYTNSWDVVAVDLVNIPNLDNRPLTRRILENDSLKQVYLAYVAEFINGPAHPDSVAARADRIKPLINSHVQADSNKLYSYEDFNANIETDVTITSGITGAVIPGIKSFSVNRNAELQRQLAGY